MTDRASEVSVFDQSSAAARGAAQGECWRDGIHALSAVCLERGVREGGFADAEALLQEAHARWPALPADAQEELEGMARAADVDPRQLMVINGHGVWAQLGPSTDPVDPGASTTLFVNGSQGPVLGHQWIAHPELAPFVRVIHVHSPDEPPWVGVTLCGHLGVTGLNAHGLAVSSNPLATTQHAPGMVAGAVLRELMRCSDAADAEAHLAKTSPCGGRFWALADPGRYRGVERTAATAIQTQRGVRAAHVHTNHFFDPVHRKHERLAPSSATFVRMQEATTLYVQRLPETAGQALAFFDELHAESRVRDTTDLRPIAAWAATVTTRRLSVRGPHGGVRVRAGQPREDEHD